MAGYLLSGFLFTPRTPDREPEGRVAAFTRRLGLVWVLHVILVLPWVLSWRSSAGWYLLLVLAVLALAHVALERWEARSGREPLALFLTFQAAHTVVVLAGWIAWLSTQHVAGPVLGRAENAESFTALILLASAYVINGSFAASLIERFLGRFPVADRAAGTEDEIEFRGMGRTIGILERMLILSLVILGQWEAVGWVFAGKTVARFRELNDRAFSEYYLIGTLSSLLFAAATGSGIRLALFGNL